MASLLDSRGLMNPEFTKRLDDFAPFGVAFDRDAFSCRERETRRYGEGGNLAGRAKIAEPVSRGPPVDRRMMVA
jgi:hypothetical protein